MATKTGHFGFVKAAARTDVGRKRKNNEDAFGVFHEAGVFCVADGMGGGDDGEIASAAVVKGLEDGLKALAFDPDGAYAVSDVADVVEASLSKASAWIFNRTRVKKLSGCGSTFVGFALDATAPGTALAVHAGDSRLYLLHGRSIKQITHDHSVAEMIGAKDESKLNPMFRSMVMNAIGIRAKADPERTPFKVTEGDRILVCSDGLSRMVPDKKILAISRRNDDVAAAADALISSALEAGGIDNVTVVLAEVGPLPAAKNVLSLPVLEMDAESAGGAAERETGATGGSATGEDDQTQATMVPTMTGEDMLAPEETDEPSEMIGLESKTWEPPKEAPRRPKRPWLAVTLGAAALVVAAVVVLCFALRREETPPRASEADMMETVAKPREGRALSRPLPRQRAALPSGDGDVATASIETVAPPVETNAVASPVSVETNAVEVPAPVETNAVESPVIVVVTNDLPQTSATVEAVVKACEGDSFAQFAQAFRRLEGAGNRELVAQMKRLESSAHFCARLRTAEGASRVVVDLKYCLTSAAKMRTALANSKKTVARKLLVWWDILLDDETSEENGLKAATQFLNHLAEAASR